jgi:hypothetical protein
MNDTNKQPAPDKSQSKKVYQHPELHVYGNLKEITQAVSNKGSMDNGAPPNTRTHA